MFILVHLQMGRHHYFWQQAHTKVGECIRKLCPWTQHVGAVSGAGETVQHLRALAAPAENWIWFPGLCMIHTHLQLQLQERDAIYILASRGTVCIGCTYMHPVAHTHAQKMRINLYNAISHLSLLYAHTVYVHVIHNLLGYTSNHIYSHIIFIVVL